MSLFDAMNSVVVDTFGTACTYTPAGGAGYAVKLVLEKPLPGDSVFPGAFMTAGGPSSQFTTAPAKGDRVTAESVTYVVFEKPEDECGWIVLALNKC